MGTSIRVLRAVRVGGAVQEPGAIVEVDERVAREIIATGKAERAGEAPPVLSAPMTTDSAPGLVPGKAHKGKPDAK
jgi:hypothetical protein